MLGCSYGSVFDCRRGNTSESDTSSDIARPLRKKPRKTTLRSTFQRYIILVSTDVLSCILCMCRSSGITSDSEVSTPVKCPPKCRSGVTSDSEVASPIKQ